MQQILQTLIASASLALAVDAHADEEVLAGAFWTGQDVSLGDLFFPHFHAIGVVGDSTAELGSLSAGDHDPAQNVDLLSLEPGLSLRLGDHIEGFITSSYLTEGNGDFIGGVEEAFVKLINLPGGLEFRGGRYFNRVGFQNARHNHSWDYVDQYLVNGRMLQEGELATIGGELTWNLPTRYPAAFSLSIGEAPSGHAHGHEDEHEHEDEHGHEDEHVGEGIPFEADSANFDDYFVSANLIGTWRYDDFHQFTGTLSFTYGENSFRHDTWILGTGLEYLWRENGLLAGGRYFRWRNEVMYRSVETTGWPLSVPDTASEVRTVGELGFYSSATYGFNEHWEASLRAEYVEGVDSLDLAERFRISPALTWSINRDKNLFMRLQYNYDHRPELGDDHSIWLGVGINWGGAEVR